MVLVGPSVDMNHSNAGVQSALLYWIRNYYHPKECLKKHSVIFGQTYGNTLVQLTDSIKLTSI